MFIYFILFKRYLVCTKDMDIITIDDLNIIINRHNDVYDNVKTGLTNDEIIKCVYDELLEKYIKR